MSTLELFEALDSKIKEAKELYKADITNVFLRDQLAHLKEAKANLKMAALARFNAAQGLKMVDPDPDLELLKDESDVA